MASREILVRLRAEVGNFRSSMAQAATAARGAGDAAEEAGEQSQRGIRGLMANAEANAEAWGTVGRGITIAGAAILAGVGLSIAKFAEFDKAMSSVDAATHETVGNMELLRAKAIEVGADTAFSAVEAAQGIEELAKAGVSTADILGGGLAGSMDLAAAGALGVADAAEISATAMVQFGLAGSDIPHIADLLAAGAGKAQGSVQDIGAALGQSGLVASQFGLTVDDTVGSLAAFASAGLTGSDAGTSFKSMLLKLAAPAKATQTLMDDLGISAYDAEGSFVGITGLADQLKNNLGDLTQAQRDSALATIFGTDAIRGANVLYEQGAAGIQDWIDNVNDAGYAAETAARMQDNLAGDIEKLGGAFDTLMIKSGTGPAEMLRGIIQAAEGAVDAVGKVPTPLLTTITIAASLVGGLALLGGAFVSIVPKIAATKIAMAGFATASPRMASGMIGIGKAAGIAAVGIIALGAVTSTFSKVGTVDAEKYTAMMLDLAKSGATAGSVLGENSFAIANGMRDAGDKIEGVGQALVKVTDISFNDTWRKGLNDMMSVIGSKDSTSLVETQKAIEGMSDALGGMVQSGNAEGAAAAFSKIVKAGADSGVSAEKVAGQFSTYESALRKQANTLGVVLKDEEYYQWMLGNTPPLIDAAASSAEGQTAAADAMAAANEETATALAEVGLAADGTVQSLGKLLEAMFAAGLTTMSTREASRSYKDSLDSLNASIATNGSTLDTSTKAGRDNEAAIDATAQAGLRHVQAMAQEVDASGRMVYSQAEVSSSLKNVYTDLVSNYAQFGITGDAADKMARQALSIPDEANVDTAIMNFADSMAKLNGVAAAADALNGKRSDVWITTHQNSIYSETHVSSGRGGSGGQTKAEGGAIYGPGTGTSDDIPAWLSNGEHVLTAAEVARMGGQSAVYRMRSAIMDGSMPAFASGGAVAGHLGESANARANRLYREAQARAAAAKKAAAARQKELAKASQYRSEQASDLYLDSARGDGYRTVTGGLSSAYSYSDKLRSVANSGNLPSQKWGLLGMANNSDASMRRLYAQSTRLTKSLETAKKRLEDLNQVKSGVSSSLSGEFNLADAVSDSSMQNGVANIGGIQRDASAKLSAIRSFGTKLNKLALKGYSGAIVQEIAAMGSGPGSVAADALLAAKATDVKKLNSTYTDITKASDVAGSYVTNAMYKGGVNAAAGLVKGLQSQEAAIEKQMLKIGLGMEKALKKALGIKSPSRVARAIGSNFGGSLSLGMADESDGVAAQAKALANAMYIAPSKSLAGGYGAGMSQSAYSGSGSNAQAAVVNVTAVVENPWTGEQVQAVVKSVATTAANGAIKSADQQSAYRRAGGR